MSGHPDNLSRQAAGGHLIGRDRDRARSRERSVITRRRRRRRNRLVASVTFVPVTTHARAGVKIRILLSHILAPSPGPACKAIKPF